VLTAPISPLSKKPYRRSDPEHRAEQRRRDGNRDVTNPVCNLAAKSHLSQMAKYAGSERENF